jgi:small subunit ribosomal protein S6
MNHYEIVFLVHPDQKSESEAILNKYCDQIKSSNGTIDRSENIGSRKLAYPIQDCYKANYFCINVTCDSDQIDSLKESFKYNDAILRHLIVRKDEIETEPSSLLKQTQEDGETQLEEYEASIKNDNFPKEATKNIDESTSDKEAEAKEEADQSDDTSDETDNSEKNIDGDETVGDETKVETENESKKDKGTI